MKRAKGGGGGGDSGPFCPAGPGLKGFSLVCLYAELGGGGAHIRVSAVLRGEGGAGPQSPVPHSLPVIFSLPAI